ncbi:chemotaxis protein CheA [Oscillospiraceae bacterium PP1C4]
MPSFDPSMEPMLEMFIYETTTLLEQLDEILLESEKSKNLSNDNVNEIFRIMHTIKGSSAMMGIENVANLSHAVEDVFFIIRETPEKLDNAREAIFDLVFQASDYFKVQVDAVQNDTYVPNNPDEMIRQLKEQIAVMNGQQAPSAPAQDTSKTAAKPTGAPAQRASVPSQAAQSAPASASNEIYQVRIFFEDGCQMENIRAFMLLSQLKDWCEYLDSVPERPESDSSLSVDIINHGFLVKFKPSSSPDDIYKVIETSINVKSYEIMPSVFSGNAAEADSESTQSDNIDSSKNQPSDSQNISSTQPKSNKQSLISVNQAKLDQLMDLVGELVTTESMVSSNPDLKGLVLDNFYKSTRELRKLTDELQDVVMSIRMVPLTGVFQKMNRIIRDMGKKLGKPVDLETIGGETEVDKTINDSITDPFMHMIRNAMDHAIESPEERLALGKPENGKVTIAAQNVGGEIVITISDDGRGLNAAKIIKKARENGILTKPENEYSDKEIYGLIMLPGFSTNEEVTEYSGRGVGMDVVRKNIEKLGGTIAVESTKNVGTTFIIKIPLTLAIVDGMEISIGDTIFTLPITSIKQSFKIFDANQVIHNTDGSELFMIRGECLPIIRLHNLFNIPTAITDITSGIVIQIENDHKAACIFADELIGEQQVVVKPFPAFLNRYNITGNGLSGCTILGDGSISLILDANSILNSLER